MQHRVLTMEMQHRVLTILHKARSKVGHCKAAITLSATYYPPY